MMRRLDPGCRMVLLAFVFGGASLAGCVPSLATPRGPDPFGSSAGGHFFLEVRNTLEEDVTIRLRAGRHSQDLGAVSARTTTRLTIPWDDHGRLSVQIEPMTGSRFTFPPREVGNGESLELLIQNPLSSSRFGR